MGMRKVYIAYTGGTVGMQPTERGSAPAPGQLGALLASLPQFQAAEMPEITLKEYDPLLDSANMTPADWVTIGEDLKARQEDHDGFMVLHGTDTMAYTASALSFLMEGLEKPVILTGSQIPLCETRSDALENLTTGLLLIERYAHRMSEVSICFGGRLLRGNRASKTDSEGFDAFESPNHPLLGTIGIDFELNWRMLRQPKTSGLPLRVRKLGDASVGACRLYPGMPARTLAAFLDGVSGCVLECYGAGNAPNRDADFMKVLRDACDSGTVIVAVPQPLRGSAALSLYATGRTLLEAGVVSGFDMTPEAALTKLSYLFACTSDPAEVRHMMQQNLRGELTPLTTEND